MAFDVAGAKQAGYSDIEIAEFLGQQKNFDTPAAIKAGYSPSEIIGHLGASEPPAVKGETGFLPSVYRGGRGLASLATDVIPAMAGKAVGAEEFAKRKMQEAAQYQQQTEQLYPAEIASYKDIKDVGSFLTYVKEAIGEAVPSIVPSIFTGGAAAVLGRGATAAAQQAGTALARRELLEATAKGTLTKELRDEIKEKAIQAGAKAAQQSVLKQQAAGALAGSAVQNIPDVYQNIYETTGQQDLGAAIAFGSFNAALDAITPFNVLRKMQKAGLRPEETAAAWYKRAGKGAAKGFVSEGGTEALQEVSSAAAEKFVDENQDFFSSKNFDRFINAGLKGGFGGAGITATTDVAFGKSKPKVKPEEPEVLEAKRAPEEPPTPEEPVIERPSPVEVSQVEIPRDIQAERIAQEQKIVDGRRAEELIGKLEGRESNQDLLSAARQREAQAVEQQKVDMADRANEIVATSYSADPALDMIKKSRALDEIGYELTQNKRGELVPQLKRETTQTTPTTKGEEDVARPNEPTSGTGVPVPVRAADELPAAKGIEGTEQRGVDGVGPAPTEPTGGTGVQQTPVKDYAYKSYEELESLSNSAKKTNHDMDIAAIKKHFGVEAADAYEKMNRFQRDKWWDANATEEFERDSSVFNGINEETIDDYITAYNKFDTESPELLGRSIAIPSLKMKEPDFIGSPEMLTINNALDYAKKQGWSEKEVIDAMRARAAEWAKGDVYELFPHLFKPKKTKESAVPSSNMEALESSEKGAGYNIDPQEQTIEKELAGKNFMQVAQWAVRSAPNAFAKVIAQKVLSRLQGMQSRGVKFDFKVEAGNERSTKLRGARGVTNFVFGKTGEDTTIKITLNGATVMDNQDGFPSGMNYVTVLHELLHAATRGQLKFMQSSDPLVKELIGLRNKIIKHFNDTDPKDMTPFMKRYYNRENNSLDNIDEMVSWGMTDEDMQKFLGEIKVGEKTGFSKLVETIRKILGLGQPYESALDRLVKTTESILDESVDVIGDGIESQGYSYGTKAGKKSKGQKQTLFSKKVQEMFGEEFGLEERKPTPVGQSSLDILDKYGRNVEQPKENRLEEVKQTLKNAADNPEITLKNAQSAFTNFLNWLETKIFSSDAALNNDIRKSMGDLGQDASTKIGMLLQTSLSQTVHSDAVANLFLRYGNIEYDNDLKKWVKKDSDANFVELSRKLDKMAEKNGFTKEQAEKIAHMAFEAKRTKSLIKFNEELQQKIDDIQAEAKQKKAKSPVASSALSEKAARMKNEFKYIHLTDEEIADGMSLFKTHPELNEVVDAWNKIRDNASKVLIESGLWSESDAEFLLSNSDYVPFYREDQLEQGKGPKEFIRGLQVQAKERKLKGSDRPVNDIFDNQVRWVQYSINRAVRNKSAISLVDAAVASGLAKKVDGPKDGDNVTRIWRDGQEEFYSMADPLYMEAFNGLESVSIPMFKMFSKFADMLRQSVVMYPLFTISQIPQDSFAAIFSSGLKPQHALKIPILAVKEFIQTLRGKSATHEELKNVGATGVRDFTSAMVRMDAEIFAGFKAPPGVLGKAKGWLTHFAMAGDNAVRQAVYEASLAQGLSKAEAMEKAFEIFNARRKGSSKTLALASQVIPFFNAYLAAQNVAYKVITGRGVSPTQRADAYKTLAATTGSVMVLSILYSMIASDDDDYLEKPVGQRDRAFIIPGTGGMMIPLRKDLFTMPKVIAEHTYLMLTDKGSEDGRKFRDSVAAGLMNSILGPTPVPQAIKPFAEVYLNYDFYQQKPLIGTYQKKLDTERQFNESTSELSKLLGQTGLISPIVADHLVRGLFGSVGGLVLYATNPFLYSGASGERPSMSFRDAVATLPGTSGFISKEYENAMKRDFYVLKDEVDKAANTFADLKTRSPQEIEEFLKDEKNVARVGMSKSVNKIADQLSKLRKYMEQVRNSDMPADEKRDKIKELKESESNMMKNIDVKALREMGKI